MLAVLLITLALVSVVGVTILSGRRKAAADGTGDSDSLSFIGGVLNALFTVVLAFYIVFAWQNGDDIDTRSSEEADALTDTYWQVGVAPEPQAAAIRSDIEQYAARVVQHEWQLLDQRRTDPVVNELLRSIRAGVAALPTGNERTKIAREQALQNVRELDDNHRERVTLATDDDSFDFMLLVGSITGAALMVVFPLLVGLSPRPANVVSMVLLTAALGCLSYVSIELLHPLDGPFAIDPDAFRTVLAQFSNGSRPG